MATSLYESGRLAGTHRWVERRLFEIVGGWVPSTTDQEAKLLFDRHSEHHAWRAGQWWERLPVLAGVDRDGMTSAPPGPMATALDRLAELATPVARLAGLYRGVLPRVWTEYDRHRKAADPVSDGSALRTLSMVIADVSADWQEGELVLQGRVVGRQSALEVGSAVAALEEIFAVASPPA